MASAKVPQSLQIAVAQRRGMAHQYGFAGAAEQLHMANLLRLAQPLQDLRQLTHNRLQGLYQYRAVADGHNVLTGGGAKAHRQLPSLGVPAHGYSCAAAITKLRANQRRRPFLRLQMGELLQLLGKRALFEGNLLAVGQVLQRATTTAPDMGARRFTTLGRGGLK